MLVVGTPGGSHIPTAVLQTVINLIDHRMTLTEAVYAPRIHAQWLPDVLYYEPDALSADTRAVLEAQGHHLESMDYWNQVAAILVGGPAIGKPPRGRYHLYGAIDPRLPTGSVAVTSAAAGAGLKYALRTATPADVPALRALIARSIRALGASDYSSVQIDTALESAFGVDTTLINDGTSRRCFREG